MRSPSAFLDREHGPAFRRRAGRRPAWALGLALLAAGGAPAGATLFANPHSPACERQAVDDALRKIRAAAPEAAAALDVIARSPLACVVTPVAAGQQSRNDTSRGSEIRWVPDTGGTMRYQGNGLCVDAVAALAHELWHCYAKAAGTADRDRRHAPGVLPKSEIDAVSFENIYRTANHLCARTTYDTLAVPGAIATCLSPPNRAERCPRPATACTSVFCCCWIYGGKKDPVSGGWLACTIDRLTPDECAAYTRPNQSNAGCYESPCKSDDTDACP